MTTKKELEALLNEVVMPLLPKKGIPQPVSDFLTKLKKALKKRKIDASVELGGSMAKGTFLKDDHDVDIFVRFNRTRYAKESDKLSDLLEKALPSTSRRVHGSRDYFQVIEKNFFFEIVPVLKITSSERALNITDVSPLHTSYVLKKLQKKRELLRDIRLAKQFCKASKTYGAESYLNGFSGHVLDLLIIHYGGFLKLLHAATKWKQRVVIDPDKHHKNPLFALNKSKQTGPLLLVDPIQPERNAAAALSQERYDAFKEAANKFLKKPKREAFTITPLTPELIRAQQKKGELIILRMVAEEGKDDVVATKLLKAHQRILSLAEEHEFTLLNEGWEYAKQERQSIHYFLFKDASLPKMMSRRGPPIDLKSDAARFKKLHRRTSVKKGRLFAEIARRYRTPNALLKAALKDSYVRARSKRISML